MASTEGKKKNFICTQDWDKAELDELLKLTKDVKENPQKYRNTLDGKSVCMFLRILFYIFC